MPTLRRVNRGSGHSYTIDGEAVPGVTTILRDGVPKGNLVGWAARTVAGYAVDHWSELHELTPSKRLGELSGAAWAERDAAAGRGSKVHEYAVELAAGAEVDVPDALAGHVDAYLAFVEAYRVEELEVEVPVAYLGSDPLHRDRYAGTADLLARLDGRPEVVLIDWKTGGSGIWPETALQLAAYAHADLYVGADGLERPMPPIDRALAVWLRGDGYDVYPVDISDRTFLTFRYAQQVARFTKAERGEYVGDALPARQLEAAS